MSLTDLSYGCQHSVHRSPVAEDNKSGSIRTFFHFRCTNVFGHLAGKWPPLLFATNLGSLSKVKVVSLLMGLTLMFIVMASYLLAWDKGGLLFTASPEHFRPAVVLSSPLARAAPDVSPEGLLDMKPLVDTITSKLDYPPRTPPDEKHIFEAFPHVSM
ncbi:unnamed protein product [Tetraodon nigroviridis]|uniref:(spotted green pufferfish) hypothetical protein n=1 Tax=Tetraodon nigroviridis TaxID=99883 RepID=Q4S2R0_TETNG|nr:unnamed protein product [Tetraodon nigroviridis]